MGKEGVLTLVLSYYETENWLLLVTGRNGACPQGRRNRKRNQEMFLHAPCSCGALQSSWPGSSSALIRAIQRELTVTIRAQERRGMSSSAPGN